MRTLNELETTSVWIFPEKDFEKHLNKNVFDRYSNGDGYSTITFISHSKNETCFSEKKERKNKGLLFIKSPFLNNNPSSSKIEFYLRKMKEIVNRELPTIDNGGFIVIQTQDVRIDKYVEPLAKRMVDMLALDNLWLKEIVVITQDRVNLKTRNLRDYLEIVHKYLLVYEVKNEETV